MRPGHCLTDFKALGGDRDVLDGRRARGDIAGSRGAAVQHAAAEGLHEFEAFRQRTEGELLDAPAFGDVEVVTRLVDGHAGGVEAAVSRAGSADGHTGLQFADTVEDAGAEGHEEVACRVEHVDASVVAIHHVHRPLGAPGATGLIDGDTAGRFALAGCGAGMTDRFGEGGGRRRCRRQEQNDRRGEREAGG